MVGNIFTQAGLISEGVDNATLRKQKIAQNEQAIQENSMGLEDLTQKRSDAKSLRNASSGQSGVYATRMARHKQRLAAGDAAGAQEELAAASAALEEAKQALALGAQNDLQPDKVEQLVTNLAGPSIKPGTLKWGVEPPTGRDGKANPKAGNKVFMYEDINGNPVVVDATAIIQSQQKVEKLNPGEIMVQGGATVASNPVKDKPMAVGANDRVYIPGKGFVGGSGAAGPASTVKELPVFKAISDAVLSLPGMSIPNKMTGEPEPSEDYGRVSALANQIYLGSGGKIDPRTTALIAAHGKPKMNQSTGERAIEYQGRMYKRDLSAGNAAPIQPAAQPMPAPQAEQAAPVEAAAQAEATPKPSRTPPTLEQIKRALEAEKNGFIKIPPGTKAMFLAQVKRAESKKGYARGGKVDLHGMC